ncbi:MAG: PH domain-containing protein [Nanoarchaeota archaeon]
MKKRKKGLDKTDKNILIRDILRVRNSRKIYIHFYLMIIILVGVVIYTKLSGRPLDDAAFKLSLAFIIAVLIATEIHRLGNYYQINDDSVIHKNGYFSIVLKRLEFNAISDSHINQTLLERFLSYGDVEIHMFSRENNLIIKNINNPFKFVEFLGSKMGHWKTRTR